MTLSDIVRRGHGFFVVALVVIALAGAAPAMAQGTDTGALNVRVLDPDGSPLPGVTVLVQGPLGTRTGYTGIDGTTRFPGLYPGDYSATFTIDGFKTVIREGLRISFARTTTVEVDMELSSVEETITVTGESPVVDVKSTNVGRLYTDDLIDKAPTASGLWAGVMDHVPGVVVGGFDVGGGSSGQQDGFSAYGSVGGQNVYSINGANTTDPDALGASSFYYSIGAFEEVGVSTASHDVETQTPGVMLNMVTKSGSNDWHAAVKYFYENDSFVGDNITPELEARGVSHGEPNTLLSDLDIQGGGPILRDRAWFFVDYWDFTIERLITNVEGAIDNTDLTNWTISGTVQLNDAHKVTARYLTDRKFRGNRDTADDRPPETAWIQDSFVDIPQLQWQGVLTQNTFADIRFSKMDMEFPLEGKDADSPAPVDNYGMNGPPAWDLDLDTYLPFTETYRQVFFQRDNTSLSGNLSHYLTGENSSHDFKFGGDFAKTQSFSPDTRSSGQLRYFRGCDVTTAGPMLAGCPAERVRLYNTPADDIFEIPAPNASTVRGTQFAFFGQDTWTWHNRMTVNAGFRFDWSKGYLPEQQRLESLWPSLGPEFLAESIPARDPVVDFANIVPRLGLIYDLRGDGQTALKFNFSMYSSTQGVAIADDVDRNGTGYLYYNWSDPNGDGLFQLGEEGSLRSRSFPGATNDVDPELSSPLTYEVSGGAEHELMNNFLLSATGIWRDTRNQDNTINYCPPERVHSSIDCAATPGLPYGQLAAQLGLPDPYTPIQSVDKGPDDILGTADDGGPVTIYHQAFGFGESFQFRTDPTDWGYDEVTRSYYGVSFVAHKRWSDNWQVLASWDIGKTEFAGGFGDGPRQDYNNRKQLSTADRTHNIKITANYLFAEPIGVNVGMFLRSLSGRVNWRENEYDETDGLNPQQGSDDYLVGGQGIDDNPNAIKRLDHVTILDLRAEKQVTIGRFGVVHLYADWFNVNNANSILNINENAGSSYGRISSIVAPRVFRIGGAWDF